MARNWTEEQKRVIQQNNSNLLVAAAAGSGKTAVMVARIIERVLSDTTPVDIDRIVVVTFTRAAAAEMKERIGKAFAEAILQTTEMEKRNRIRKQIALLDNAVICTIDSFCNFILRNYFNTIDLDPAFRIGDEGELRLLMSDVADEVIEAAYAEESEDFIDFVEAFVPGKTDKMLASWIMKLYDFSTSHPFPEKWLKSCEQDYNITSEEEFEGSRQVAFIINHIKQLFGDYIEELKRCIEICRESGLYEYIDVLKRDCETLWYIRNAKTYGEMQRCTSFEFERLPNARQDVDKETKEWVQGKRNNIKKRISKLREEFFSLTTQENVEMISGLRKYVRTLVKLTLDFTQKYDETKSKNNILSFSDIEHLALKVLIHEEEDGSFTRTFAAEELAALYEEIYIDEYQDSNMVQELILKAVSRQEEDTGNMFMVGDIKQSIYSFRQADPGIFLEKYRTYTENGEKGNVLITLHRNFRSRENVLNCVNDIFKGIMHAALGGVEYDRDAMLVPGKAYPEDEQAGGKTELLLYETSDADEDALGDVDSVRDRKIRAGIIGKRIKKMLEREHLHVWDNSLNQGEGGYRDASYRDIVILLRSSNVAGPEYVEVLMENGIPAVCNTSVGYFSAFEVSNILNMLNVIDNPRQDIPLAGALRSYFCYMTAEELAWIKGIDSKAALYDCILKYTEEGEKEEIREKLKQFLLFIREYRTLSEYMPIHELVRKLIYDTGYITYAAAMEGGKRRTANLDMLVTMAKEYEATSFHGLFNFLRYIEKIQKYEIDTGEADTLSENDDVVRIMSIHKSKGLEFPIVFVSDMNKKFNLSDSRDRIIFSASYGINMDYVDLPLRIRRKAFFKRTAAENIKMNAIGEELRVLYVALTRAAEKLIMVGTVKDMDKKFEQWKERVRTGDNNYSYVYECNNYLDLCAPAFFKAAVTGEFEILRYTGRQESKNSETEEKLVYNNQEKINEAINIEETEEMKERAAVMEQRFQWKYPYEISVRLPGKLSVSELKHESMEEVGDESVTLIQPEEVKRIPCFMKEEEEEGQQVRGTERGNAYHKVFELLDYEVENDYEALKESFDRMVTEGKLSADYRKLINAGSFLKFLNSDIGKRMKAAALKGQLFREQQFITGFPAYKLRKEYEDCQDMVLLQGIIDCYFYEEDGIVIVDYKTDHVSESDYEYVLKSRYSKQLELYGEAVGQLTGIPVKESLIYSVSIGKEVKIC